MQITQELKGVPEALNTLRLVARDGELATARAMTSIGRLVQREAQRNAPRSSTRGQQVRQRKTNRKVKRRARATSRPSPGQLANSIKMVATSDEAIIFVAANSSAGKYAGRIHNKKNAPGGWKHRGPGTRAKGARADEKFIARAIVDEEGNILKIIKSEHKKAGWYELR